MSLKVALNTITLTHNQCYKLMLLRTNCLYIGFITIIFIDNNMFTFVSRAFYKDDTRRLVSYFGWDDYFDFIEIYPGSKISHFLQ